MFNESSQGSNGAGTATNSYPPTVTNEDQEKSKADKKLGRKCKCKGFADSDIGKNKRKKIVGSLWFREQELWKDFIRKHRKDLRLAQPVVDDKPPHLNVSSIYDVEILSMIRNALRSIFELNLLLVKSLHTVNVSPGKTDTFTFNYKRPETTNYFDRREEAKFIEKQNQIMSNVIKYPKPMMMTVKQYAEEWKKNESIMENSSQFPLFWKVKKQTEDKVEISPPVHYFKQYVTEKSAKYSDKRPRVVFEVSIKNVGVVGKMMVMLYSDYVPMTVKNFLAFCDPKAELTYKGDVVENRGYGGTSIYGPYFGNEDLTLKHGERGMLTMYTKIPNRNESQFLITFRKLESLDGHNVAFGKVIKGFHVLDAIESVGSKKTGRPKVEIYISDCDEV